MAFRHVRNPQLLLDIFPHGGLLQRHDHLRRDHHDRHEERSVHAASSLQVAAERRAVLETRNFHI